MICHMTALYQVKKSQFLIVVIVDDGWSKNSQHEYGLVRVVKPVILIACAIVLSMFFN